MSCSFYEILSPYCDGELDNPQAKEIKEHLENCAVCQKELDYMLQIRNSLKQGAANTKAPSHLEKKILSEVHPAQRTIWIPRLNFARAAALAAMVLFTFILIFHYWPGDRDSFTDVVDALVKYHALYEPGEKSLSLESSDSEDAELWVKRKLGLEFSVPNAAFAGYELQGADGFERRGRKYAYLKYQKDGKIIGYIIFKDKGFSIDMPETVNIDKIKIQIGKMKETNIAVWKKGGLVYFILTFEDRSELLEYARRCIKFF